MSSHDPRIVDEVAREVDTHRIGDAGSSGEKTIIADPSDNPSSSEDDSPHQTRIAAVKAIEG